MTGDYQTAAIAMAAIPLAFAILYGIFGGIEFGLPLAALLHDKEGSDKAWRYFSPIWESTNVFLVGVVAAVMTIFGSGLPLLSALLQPLWLVAAGALAVRGVLIVGIYYGGWRNWAVQVLLAVVSLAIPAVLVQNCTILLTGDADLLNHLGLVVALGTLAVSLAVALWAGYFYEPGKPSRDLARLGFWLALMLSWFTLPLALALDGSVLSDGRNVLSVMWPVYGLSLVAVLALASEWRRRYWVASALLTASVSITLFVAQMPYLIRPTVLLADMMTNGFSQVWIAAAFGVAVFVVVPVLWVTHRLVGSSLKR
jgi:hypothetical protein